MTALVINTDIPSGINTVEKLHAWSGLVLAYVNPQLTAIEGVGYSERVAQAGPFFIAASNKHRMLIRTSLELNADYQMGNLKLWQYQLEFSTTAIPAAFKAN